MAHLVQLDLSPLARKGDFMSALRKIGSKAVRGLLTVLFTRWAYIPCFGFLVVGVWIWFAAGFIAGVLGS
jgi:hypothetical protein